MKILQKLRTAKVNAGISKLGSAWYRGHADTTWELQPKLLRYGHKHSYIDRIENEIFSDFCNDYKNYLPEVKPRDSWDVLCAMQHYGVSTRLLDWTTEVNVALYFAIQSIEKINLQKPDTWPCIWVLNPYKLNGISVKDYVVFDRADPLPYDYYKTNISTIRDNKVWPHEMPIAFNPGFSNPRIQAQHGRFTIHGHSHLPLDTQSRNCSDFWGIQKVTIDPNDFGELKRHLVRSPSYHLNLFPDILGYTTYLNHKGKIR